MPFLVGQSSDSTTIGKILSLIQLSNMGLKLLSIPYWIWEMKR